MAIKLLKPWNGYAAGTILNAGDAATEAALVASMDATYFTAGGIQNIPNPPYGNLQDVPTVAGISQAQAANSEFRSAFRSLPRRCNPIVKHISLSNINQSGGVSVPSTSTACFGIKIKAPGDYYAVRLHIFNQGAFTPNIQAVIAATETADFSTGANMGQPIVGGSAVTALDSTTTPYGWRTVTFGGSSTGVHSGTGTLFAPNILSSDIIPVTSVPRADGGIDRLFMMRLVSPDAATNRICFTAPSALMQTATGANRGNIYQAWWDGTATAVTNPAGFTPTALTTSATVVVAVEFFTHAVGSTMMFVGDSLTANEGLVADKMSSLGLRVASDISSLASPVGFINCGCSAQNSATYFAAGLQQLTLFRPSAVFYPIWSPNDYFNPATDLVVQQRVQAGLAYASRFIDEAKRIGTEVVLWTGVPNSSATGLNTVAKDAIRKSVNALLKNNPGVLVADFDAFVTDGQSPADFLTAYSFGDKLHFNEPGIDYLAINPANAAARAVLR